MSISRGIAPRPTRDVRLNSRVRRAGIGNTAPGLFLAQRAKIRNCAVFAAATTMCPNSPRLCRGILREWTLIAGGFGRENQHKRRIVTGKSPGKAGG
jgi:hypothetical protein